MDFLTKHSNVSEESTQREGRTLNARSAERTTGLLEKDENGWAYQHGPSPLVEDRNCDKNEAIAVDEIKWILHENCPWKFSHHKLLLFV